MTGRIRRRHLGATVGAVFLSLMFATSAAAAVSWTPAVAIRSTNGLFLAAADFSDSTVAVSWVEDVAGGRDRVGIRVSTNAGDSFGSATFFDRAFSGALDVCGDEVNFVFVKLLAGGERAIVHAVRDISGGWHSQRLAEGPTLRTLPDVACTDGRVFVSWMERDGGDVTFVVTNALSSDRVFGPPNAIGTVDSESSIQIAATPSAAFAAFGHNDGRLRVKRWDVGPGPDFSVDPNPTQVVASGTPNRPADFPEIAADGETVALGWSWCSGLYARVSNDNGHSWKPIQPIRKVGCNVIIEGGFGISNISAKGDRVAMVVSSFGIPNFEHADLLRTRNGFETFRVDPLGDHQGHLAGFVTVGGEVKVADTFSKHGDTLKFRRQI